MKFVTFCILLLFDVRRVGYRESMSVSVLLGVVAVLDLVLDERQS